jgi:hypothetical protein
MEPEDKFILDHFGRYNISPRKVVESICPSGINAGNTMNRLLREGLIQRVANGLDGNYSYYQLTSKGANIRNVPQNRARPKDAKGLGLDLAVLWFSCMGDKRRKRLTQDELKSLFGAPKGGNVINVAQDDIDEESCVFRIFAPSATASLRAFLPTLKKSTFDLLADEKILSWAERGTFRTAVLVHSDDRKDDLAALIRNDEFPNMRIEIAVVPTPSTLRQFIRPDKETD